MNPETPSPPHSDASAAEGARERRGRRRIELATLVARFGESRGRTRASLQRVLHSLFSNNLPDTAESEDGSTAAESSSNRSLIISDSTGQLSTTDWTYNAVGRSRCSTHSIEMVSPGTFIFSGPELGESSTRDNMSRHSSLTFSEFSLLTRTIESSSTMCTPSITQQDIDGEAESSTFPNDSIPSDDFPPASIPPPPTKGSLFQSLPAELLQQIYTFLPPHSFNSFRHTCRALLRASLSRTLLELMLKRGGWISSLRHDIKTYNLWTLSSLLSHECLLLPTWNGNGLTPSCGCSTSCSLQKSIKLTGKIDFSELASGYAPAGGQQSGGLLFTASQCGSYLLAAEGCVVYVYRLFGSDLYPLTSIVCPKRVLAMTICASDEQFAVAALLDGRIGVLCDLTVDREPAALRESIRRSSSKGKESVASSSSSFRGRHPDGHPSEAALESAAENLELRGRPSTVSLMGVRVEQNGSIQNRSWNIRTEQARETDPPTIHIESGPRSIYHHVCSDDDAPRSVAICPQRRCVAFGCSAGIELHWVDRLTGAELHRWFPLTSPSDFLYFIPPRVDQDDHYRLRLISSAAHPSQQPAICRRLYAPRNRETQSQSGTGTTSFWGPGMPGRNLNLPITTQAAQGAGLSIQHSDHFRAVPLSDGFHIIYMDPPTEKLWFGCDAAFGSPTRLVRKVMLDAPKEGGVPGLYAVADDLSCGARIVASYGKQLVLFTVPPDVLDYSRRERMAMAKGEEFRHGSSMAWQDWIPRDEERKEWWHEEEAVWPLRITGVPVAEVEGLVDLAVHCSPELTIWAFTLSGQALVWQADAKAEKRNVTERIVDSTGRIVDVFSVDFEGNVVVSNADVDDALKETNTKIKNVGKGLTGDKAVARVVWYGADGEELLVS
ncbi:hypothetical protein K402DRAFT_420041 [Aulographum hederae CBS 113979]|uniref:F-box domain-containing protein n=1 Tax=Aulographum hederae CBS 113979 TaxID=1176131 RepID=A0A6G1H3N2_9PEZI|nr:hypothetical protein K402DRAFT_420041 [Aulographum hederae CBS 113979]